MMHLLLVDDHWLFSDGLAVLLRELEPDVIISRAGTIAEAVQADGVFDLLLLDLHLPDAFGFDGLTRLKLAHEATPIVVVSGEDSAAHIRECIHLGAMGFVPKSSNTTDLFTALRRILAGNTYLPEHSIACAAESSQVSALPKTESTAHLTRRQQEVLAKLIQGKANKVIAREMGISDTTVKTHVIAVLNALGVRNRTEAVYKSASLGLTQPPPAL